MKKFEMNIDGVDLFFLGGSTDEFSADDLVVEGRHTAVFVYYVTSEFPRFHVSSADDWQIDESGSVVAYSDICCWEEDTAAVDRAYFLFSHDYEDYKDLKQWELEYMTKAFMESQGCDFVISLNE